MTLREFLKTCNTNTARIDVYNKNNEKLYDGMLYLIFHNASDDNDNKLSEQQCQELLDSNVSAWELNNDISLSIFCGG